MTTTPATLKVSPGAYALKLTKIDFKDWTGQVEIKANVTTPVTATMEAVIPKPPPTPPPAVVQVLKTVVMTGCTKSCKIVCRDQNNKMIPASSYTIKRQ